MRTPTLRYRVLATDWEGESYTECWTADRDSAIAIALALRVRDVSVQIDELPSAPAGLDAGARKEPKN